MIPKFSNASAFLDATEIVTRSDLCASEQACSELGTEQNNDLVLMLNETIEASLNVNDLHTPAHIPEDNDLRRKRRKVHVEDEQPEPSFCKSNTSMEVPYWSSSSIPSVCYTRNFYFGAKAVVRSVVSDIDDLIVRLLTYLFVATCRLVGQPPPCEDTEHEKDTRHRRAEAVAVDLSWITEESRKVYLVRSCK